MFKSHQFGGTPLSPKKATARRAAPKPGAPRKRQSKTNPEGYTETELMNAVNYCIAHQHSTGFSLHEVSTRTRIPYETLRLRLKGGKSHSLSKDTLLTPAQNQQLVFRIIAYESMGEALSHDDIIDFVHVILDKTGNGRRVGRNWVSRFIKRNPVLRTSWSTILDSSRANTTTIKALTKFFLLLGHASYRLIDPSRIFNMDESGFMEGKLVRRFVVGKAGKKAYYVKSSEARKSTTVVECISAAGEAISPLTIFKGMTVQHQWFGNELKGIDGMYFKSSANGYTSNATCLTWLKAVFDRDTAFNSETGQYDYSKPRLLTLDNHASHCTQEFIEECMNRNILLLFLPPHSSHITQPLDVGVFSSLKTAYRKLIRDLRVVPDKSKAGNINFTQAIGEARKAALTPSNIKSGFRATGIYPYDPPRVLKNPRVLDTVPLGDSNDALAKVARDYQNPIPERLQMTEIGDIKSSKVIKTLSKRFTDHGDATFDHFIDKIGEAFDTGQFREADLEQQVQILSARVSNLESTANRGKARGTDSNLYLVTVDDLRRAKMALGLIKAPGLSVVPPQVQNAYNLEPQTSNGVCDGIRPPIMHFDQPSPQPDGTVSHDRPEQAHQNYLPQLQHQQPRQNYQPYPGQPCPRTSDLDDLCWDASEYNRGIDIYHDADKENIDPQIGNETFDTSMSSVFDGDFTEGGLLNEEDWHFLTAEVNDYEAPLCYPTQRVIPELPVLDDPNDEWLNADEYFLTDDDEEAYYALPMPDSGLHGPEMLTESERNELLVHLPFPTSDEDENTLYQDTNGNLLPKYV